MVIPGVVALLKSSEDNSDPLTGTSSRLTMSIAGHRESSFWTCETSKSNCNADADGTGDVSTQGTPARRARSLATSGAFQVGARSSKCNSSCSSMTTMDVKPAHGASTAERAPITMSTPAFAASQSSGTRAVVNPRRRSAAAPITAMR